MELENLALADPLFFFGAGASAVFGIPTMKEMVPLFKEELKKRKGPDIEEEAQLYSAVETILRKDFDRVDLEAVFSVIDGVAGGLTPKELGYLQTFFVRRAQDPSLLNPPPDILRNAARRLLGKFEEFVKEVCWVDPEKLDQIVGTYLTFFNEIGQRGYGDNSYRYKDKNYYFNSRWEMFTTNYDNALEVFWRDGIGQLELNTGFDHDARTRTEALNPQRLLRSDMLKLVKLHGSVTWWIEEGTNMIVEKEQPPNQEFVTRRFRGQVMLYPIQQKDTFLPPYIDMFYSLKEGLRKSSKWLVIGYSFADEIIRALFAHSSTSNTKLVLVHPDERVVKKIEDEPGWRGQTRQISTRFGEPQVNREIATALQAS